MAVDNSLNGRDAKTPDDEPKKKRPPRAQILRFVLWVLMKAFELFMDL